MSELSWLQPLQPLILPPDTSRTDVCCPHQALPDCTRVSQRSGGSEPRSFGESCCTALENRNSLVNCRKTSVTTLARVTVRHTDFWPSPKQRKDLSDQAVFLPHDWFSEWPVWDVTERATC